MKNPDVTGAEEELSFWKEFVHSEQFSFWLRRGEPPAELDSRIVQLIRDRAGRVLDVGSGVVSILWSFVEELTATDLLARSYAEIFDYKGLQIKPPLAIAAEDLPYYEDFEVVFMRNAMDHCQDPERVWENLKRSTTRGGLLIVSGFKNEGTFLHQLGMHQWDLSIEGDSLVLRSAVTKVKAELVRSGFSTILADEKTLPNGRDWVTWVGRKE